jgi:hypothetical protein
MSSITTVNRDSFVSDYIFIGTDIYIQIIFVSFKTDAYNIIFVGLGQEPTNI